MRESGIENRLRMAKQKHWVQVDKRKLEISNLDKVLFPEDGIVKAQVIEYYLSIAPTLLQHVKNRALTLIRYPDGIHGEMFYQKNRPEWAPKWVEFAELGSEDKKDYIVATEPALLVWLANLAALELHQIHSRKPHFDKPDYMVFDLDPPEGYSFKKIIDLAIRLKTHVEDFGYTPFVKTTGGKGVHICCPLIPHHHFHDVFEAAQAIAQPFVDANGKETTLHIKKDARKGRVLIDIYRIRAGQSIVSPYSLRGRVGAPVSMPLTWEQLKATQSPREYTIHNAIELVTRLGDAWATFDAFAVEIHTHRKKVRAKKLPESKRRKTPEQLKSYEQKRDFSKTPEPEARIVEAGGNNFVVHRHHASHLHYDLRLEQEGVLKSWAVPKGLPPLPGIKRLAVQTEDHPMEYLTFDGKIPKGQYGAGEMWIYALGKYQITKEKKDGFYFRLTSKEVTGEYRIYKIQRAKEWLLERVDRPQVDFLTQPFEPMLAEAVDQPPQREEEYIYEVKWDGIRALIVLNEGKISIRTRNNLDITAQFPELTQSEKSFRATCGVFDGEIVCLDAEGRPLFKNVIKRMNAKGSAIATTRSKHPAVCYVFDCLYLDGRPIVNEPLLRRKSWLKDALKADNGYRFSETVDDGHSLFEAARAHRLEGIMAKRKDSRYYVGKRSDAWLKVKVRDTRDCAIIGYTPGKGNRHSLFGALQLAEHVDGKWLYRGKVGTGFDDQTMQTIFKRIRALKETRKPAMEGGKVMDEKVTVWVQPKLNAEINFAMITADGMFREPVFVKLVK